MADAANPVGAEQAILPPSGEQVVEAPPPVETSAAPSAAPVEETKPAAASDPASTDAPIADQPAESQPTDAQPAEALPGPPAVPVDPALQAVNDQLAACREKPSDFDKWVALITAAEKLGDIVKLREVYDGFLAEFPLCYGYWKKYADAEHRNGMLELAVSVFERGTAAIPYSVDLWGHMCTYKISQNASADEVRSLFEQGLAYVGTDYLSHGLWDKYLAYELAQNDTLRVAAVYQQVLSSPIRDLDRYFNSFKDFAAQRALAALVPAEEMGRIRSEIKGEQDAQAASAAEQPASASEPVKAADGDTAMTDAIPEAGVPPAAAAVAAPASAEGAAAAAALPVTQLDAAEARLADPLATSAVPDAVKADADGDTAMPSADGPSADPAAASAAEAEAKPEIVGEAPAAAADDVKPAAEVAVSDDDVKARWQAGVGALHEASKAERGHRQPFEDGIKRPYFHVKPLDAGQLANWSRYLDFMDKKGDAGAAVRLYERCVVPCASYPEYWERYVRYLETSQDVPGARAALQRATLVHCKAQAEVHLFSALFEERHGDVEAARAAHVLVQGKLAAGLLSAMVQHANFERRQGQLAAAKAVFEGVIEAEAGKAEAASHVFAVIQYAAFLQQAVGDSSAARLIYEAALAKRTSAKSLWEGAIHLEEQIPGEDKGARILALYARAVAPGEGALPSGDREELSARSVVAADALGSAADVEAASTAHASLVASLPKAKTSGKRAADSAPAGGAAKQAKSFAATPASATPAATPAASAAAAPAASYYGQHYGYGGYYPGYPPASTYPSSYPAYPYQ